jgi:hypothetical protein
VDTTGTGVGAGAGTVGLETLIVSSGNSGWLKRMYGSSWYSSILDIHTNPKQMIMIIIMLAKMNKVRSI